MTSLSARIPRRFTPPMPRSDSPNRPVVRRKHWFLQETRFLFLTRKGPVEITVKPALILGAAFVSLAGTGVVAAATLFVGYKSVEVATNESITPAEASAPHFIATDERPNDEAAADSNLPVTRPAMAVTPPPSWPPSLASTGTVAPITVPPQPAPMQQNEDIPAHLHEPDMMIPIPSPAELAALTPSASSIPAPSNSTLPRAGTPDHQVETIMMMTPPPEPAPPPADDGLNMVPDAGGDLPVFGAESRRRKLLRSMAREVRGIRESLIGVGLSETDLPEIGSLQAYIEQADFASLAMAVEDHRSALRKVPLKPPMLYFYISGNYGWRKHPVLKDGRFHHGIDLAGTWQETVHAPAPGTVIFAGRKGSFGKVVQVRHAYGVTTTYAHLAKITVRKGADVVPGAVVGKTGRTGRVAGARLHYEIRLGDKSLDPQLFFDIGHRIGVGGELMPATGRP